MTPTTITITEAMKRHIGVSREQFQLMLLRKELVGKKVNGIWCISIKSLNQLFGGIE